MKSTNVVLLGLFALPLCLQAGAITGVSVLTNPVLTPPNQPVSWVTGATVNSGQVEITFASNAVFSPESGNPWGGLVGPLTATFNLANTGLEGDNLYGCFVAFSDPGDCQYYNNFAPLYQGWVTSGDTLTVTGGIVNFFTDTSAGTPGWTAGLNGSLLTITHNPPDGSSSGTVNTIFVLRDVGSSVPEPGTMAMLGGGLLATLAAFRRKRA